MKTSALIGYASALIASTAIAAPYPTMLAHKEAQRFITGVPPGSKTLYDQNKDASGPAVISQAADDFVVPKGHTWMIKEVDVTGVYFNGSGPASSENVSFFRDNGGLPGDPIVECDNEKGADNGYGSFAIELSKSCKVKLSGGAAPQAGNKSKGKTYWVSVQANLNFSQGGEWGWNLSADTTGNPAAYRDDSCPTWCALESDLMFALKGKDKH